MRKLINKGRRRLGIPGRPAIILEPNESAVVDEVQVSEMRRNRTVARWLEAGVLVLMNDDGVVEIPKPEQKTRPGLRVKKDRDKRVEVVLPEGVSGKGVERNHIGGGWWEVYVNGFKVTDRNIRKDEAKSIAAEYE